MVFMFDEVKLMIVAHVHHFVNLESRFGEALGRMKSILAAAVCLI